MEPTASSTALVSSALARLGIDTPPKHLSGRKGANTWRAGNWTVKTAVPGARGHLAHETDAYTLLHHQGFHPGVQHHHGEAGRWLAVPWIDGQSLWDLFAPARERHATGEQRTLMREAARHVLVALEEFHDAGWVHGDMQTENVIHTRDGGIEFIDFDNARHPDLPVSHPYRGGLIHVIAPETAQQLLATADTHDVALTPQAELFALGASLFWSWTGTRITQYRGAPDGPHPDILTDIAAGRRRNLAADRPWADPVLERLITAATRPEPHTRSYRG
ncbi:protein kinase family protein [Streptomyces cyaneofuscatus]|uniref:hypothetical protein n=1 Tax=Streptomyces cyaneofuscatus TaxID=66883 RepID=UPI0036A9577B